MAVRLTVGAANALLAGLKANIDLGFINIYSGSQPNSADLAAGSILLATGSIDGAGTGLTWETPAGGKMTKPVGVNWKATGVADGVAGWARIFAPGDDPAIADPDAERIDMVCTRTGSTECILSTTTVTTGGDITIDAADIVMPLA